jgi:hypothetical protein
MMPSVEAKTDSDGRFRLEGVPTQFTRVSLAEVLGQSFGERKAATSWDPVFVDLGSERRGAVVDIGEHFVPESRPFFLDVMLDFDTKWLERCGVEPDRTGRAFDFKVLAVDKDLPRAGLTTAERYAIWGGGSILPTYDEETRTIHWATDPSPTPPEFALTLSFTQAGGELSDFSYRFTPFAGSHVEDHLFLPPR